MSKLKGHAVMFFDIEGNVIDKWVVCDECAERGNVAPLTGDKLKRVNGMITAPVSDKSYWEEFTYCISCHRLMPGTVLYPAHERLIDEVINQLDNGIAYKECREPGWYNGSPKFTITTDKIDRVIDSVGFWNEEYELIKAYLDEVDRIRGTLRYRLYWITKAVERSAGNVGRRILYNTKR